MMNRKKEGEDTRKKKNLISLKRMPKESMERSETFLVFSLFYFFYLIIFAFESG